MLAYVIRLPSNESLFWSDGLQMWSERTNASIYSKTKPPTRNLCLGEIVYLDIIDYHQLWLDASRAVTDKLMAQSSSKSIKEAVAAGANVLRERIQGLLKHE